MKNNFYKMFFDNIIPDFIALLSADINSEVSVRKITGDEIYTKSGNYFEIVGMKRRINLFQRFLPWGKFEGRAIWAKN